MEESELLKLTEKLETLKNKMLVDIEEEKELKLSINEVMKKDGKKRFETGRYIIRHFIKTTNKITDERFIKIKETLKEAEGVAVEDGLFEQKKTDVITYTKK